MRIITKGENVFFVIAFFEIILLFKHKFPILGNGKLRRSPFGITSSVEINSIIRSHIFLRLTILFLKTGEYIVLSLCLKWFTLSGEMSVMKAVCLMLPMWTVVLKPCEMLFGWNNRQTSA